MFFSCFLGVSRPVLSGEGSFERRSRAGRVRFRAFQSRSASAQRCHRRARRKGRAAFGGRFARASRALTAPLVDGVWPACPFGERSRPVGRIAHQKDMKAICHVDETQSRRRRRSEAEESRSDLTAARRRGPGRRDRLIVI